MIARRMIVSMFAVMLLALVAPARGQSLPDFAKVVACKIIKDNAERLQCYDRALSEAPSQALTMDAESILASDWRLSESMSSVDDSQQVAAVLEATDGSAALVLRCYDKSTDAFISLRTYLGEAEPLPIVYRINDNAPVEARWLPSREGNAVFVPNQTIAAAFIRSLPDEANLFVRVRDFHAHSAEFMFKLGPIADIRDKIAAACKWPAEQRPAATPPVASTGPSTSSPRPQRQAARLIAIPAHLQRWNVAAQHPQRKN